MFSFPASQICSFFKEFGYLDTTTNHDDAKYGGGSGISLTWHMAQCEICRSEVHEEIKQLFIDWHSPQYIMERYSNLTPDKIYRHARAFGLRAKRLENSIACLEQIAGQWDQRYMNSAQVLSAAKELAKLTRSGAKAEQPKAPDLRELLARMSQGEREDFARHGTLPDWLLGAKAATPLDIPEREVDENKGYTPGKAATDSSSKYGDSSLGSSGSEALDLDSSIAKREPRQFAGGEGKPFGSGGNLDGGSPPCLPSATEGI
jgi:hypothetical protein